MSPANEHSESARNNVDVSGPYRKTRDVGARRKKENGPLSFLLRKPQSTEKYVEKCESWC